MGQPSFTIAKPSWRGVPTITKKYLIGKDFPDLLRPALWWEGGGVGIAETCCPHPKGWVHAGGPKQRNLEYMTVKALTAILRTPHLKPPSCEAAWPKALGMPIPFHEVWARLCSPLLTPRDFKAQARIYHRSLMTRNHNPDATSPNCRCCNEVQERLSHLAKCRVLRETFNYFIEFARSYHPNLRLTEALIYLGVTSELTTLKGSLSDLHVILWKFTLIAFTKVDEEGTKFTPMDVWSQALRRFGVRLQAHQEGMRIQFDKANSYCLPPPSIRSANKTTLPLARYEENGSMILTPKLRIELLRIKTELTDQGTFAHFAKPQH